MKKIFNLLVLITVFFNVAGMETPTTKKQPIIISDFDRVWINATGLVGALVHLYPIEPLWEGKPTKDMPHEEKKLHKFTLKFLDYGRHHPKLSLYIPQLIEYLGKSRRINYPIHNLYRYLKNEGHSLVIATNKDRLLYDFAIETLGNEISHMVDKVFVSEPKNDATALAMLQAFADKPTTAKKYKDMIDKAINPQPTKNIFHVPSKKPAHQYFTYMIDHIGPDNDMIFIDDTIKNVEAFNALQKNSSYLRRGIHYDAKNPNKFVEELIKLNLVSEIKDKKLLEGICCPGVMGKK